MLRETRPSPTMFASLLLACLLVLAGGSHWFISDMVAQTGSASATPSQHDDLSDLRDGMHTASAALVGPATESPPVPAECEGDDAIVPPACGPVLSRTRAGVGGHTGMAPPRDIRHPGRGPPYA